MNIGLVNTFDSIGGAAKAVVRLHREFIKSGNISNLYVQNKQKDEPGIYGPIGKYQKIISILAQKFDTLPLLFYPKRQNSVFTVGLLHSLNLKKHESKFDVINYHWTSGGFQSINSLILLNKPVVLTLHDSWAYTGGCHVPFDCTNFTNNCGNCPQLNSNRNNDLSNRLLLKKKKLWSKKKIVVVGGSNWIADNARKSSILKDHRIEVIHPGLDLSVFKPLDKSFCKEVIGVDKDDKVLLFGAVNATEDINKGYHLLIPALKKLKLEYPEPDKLKLIVFGSSSPSTSFDIGFDIKYMGRIYDDITLSVLYSAADVMIVPSIQESFGQTASESFACGTPVVAFDTSGLKDIVDHKINGYLAKPFDSNDLCSGILWILSIQSRLFNLGIEARKKALLKFDIKECVAQYLKIFESIL